MVSAVDPILSIRNLVKVRRGGAGYRLNIPRLEIARGERIALTGSSGSGKSTALDILSMALQPDAADCFTFKPGEQPIDLMGAWRSRRRTSIAGLRMNYIGYVLQTGGLLPFITVRRNISIARSALGLRPNGFVEALAARLGIERLLDAKPGQLSVGERQRVAIARAMATCPKLILADEPTAALDPINAEEVLRLLTEVVQEHGATLVVATHDWGYAARSGAREIRVRLDRDPQSGDVKASMQG
jgi:putative ABC transport system ATP-binding protein